MLAIIRSGKTGPCCKVNELRDRYRFYTLHCQRVCIYIHMYDTYISNRQRDFITIAAARPKNPFGSIRPLYRLFSGIRVDHAMRFDCMHVCMWFTWDLERWRASEFADNLRDRRSRVRQSILIARLTDMSVFTWSIYGVK